MDERFEHVEAPDRADAGTVKLCLPETAPVSQHREEGPPGVFVPTRYGTRTAFRGLASAAAVANALYVELPGWVRAKALWSVWPAKLAEALLIQYTWSLLRSFSPPGSA